MTPDSHIHIADAALARDLGGLLSVLESLLPLRFESADAPERKHSVGRVVALGDVDQPSSTGVPFIALPAASAEPDDAALTTTQVRFADDSRVPWPFRGRTLHLRAMLDARAHASLGRQGDIVLASDETGKPIWTVNSSESLPGYRTSLRPPLAPLGSDVGLASGGERFVQALPLFHFLRESTKQQQLSNPRLRAAYIIDDPNLHWPHYGYANYRDIAASARHHRYHVAFATIPLDAWWVHSATAEIFRAQPDGLSLLVHGNNHAKHELAQHRSPQDCAALLRQAGARIRQLESKAGLNVSRVMVPPHGACSAQMLAQLPLNSFESACISAGSLRAHNAGQAWTRSLGLSPSELVEGCPVLPRWAFAGANDSTLLTAAYLGQPLILRGHHQDLKDGLDVFESFAKVINSLGNVHWGNLSELSRVNYCERVHGSTQTVRPLGTHVRVTVPQGVDQLRIQSSGFEWKSPEAPAAMDFAGDDLAMPVQGGRTYSLIRRLPRIEAEDTPRLRTSAKLILRRILTETRDRLRVA